MQTLILLSEGRGSWVTLPATKKSNAEHRRILSTLLLSGVTIGKHSRVLSLKPSRAVARVYIKALSLVLLKVTRKQWKGETEMLKPKVYSWGGGDDPRLSANEARRTHNTH